MPQMDLGARMAMVLLVALLVLTVVVYHVWLDRFYQRRVRREKRERVEAEGLPRP